MDKIFECLTKEHVESHNIMAKMSKIRSKSLMQRTKKISI